MKETVTTRINQTFEYIKDFYNARGVYPTYREIQENCHYSSLSLLHRDIDLLVDLKKLAKNEHKKFVLKETSSSGYGFPLLFASDAVNNPNLLNKEEKELLSIQYEYLRGEYQTAIPKLNKLYETSSDRNVRFGCLLTKCCCSLYTGDSRPWKEAFLVIFSFEPKTEAEKMSKELCIYFLSAVLGNRQNCPKWLKEGRFYGLQKKGMPLAKVTFVSTIIAGGECVKPYILEPLCSDAWSSGIDICRIYMDLYLAMNYHYAANDEYLFEHLQSAVKTCIKNDWITPLVEMRQSLGSALENFLTRYDESFIKKIDSLHKVLSENFPKVYRDIAGGDAQNRFTLREAEIANYVRLGLSNKEIASKLCLSVETIKYYLSSIYLKANVSSRNELRELMNKR